MSDLNKDNKEIGSIEAVFKDPSSPKTNKKEKTKYQAFRSDDSLSSENEDFDQGSNRLRRKVNKQRNTSFKVKIKSMKDKKKDKEKEKEKKKDKDKQKKKLKKGNTEENIDNVEYPLHGPIFGVPLDVAVERSSLPDKIELPRIVRECILFIEEKGLTTEGIYRVSGVKSKVDQLKALYNEGRPVSLDDCDANNVASLLKLYLRELPSSILTARLTPIFDSFINMENVDEQIHQFLKLLNDLPCPNRTLLQWMFTHFRHIIEQGSETKMNIQNLSIVFSPTMKISHGVLNIFFEHCQIFFPDVELVKYAPPTKNEDEDGYPTTIEGLQEILKENEEVLSELHGKANQGDGSKDEELWERQRKATQIKRKIKLLQKAEKEKKNENKLSSQNQCEHQQEQQQLKDAEPEKPKTKPTIAQIAASSQLPSKPEKPIQSKQDAEKLPVQKQENQTKKISEPRKAAPKPPKNTVDECKTEIKVEKDVATSNEDLNDEEYQKMLLEEKKLMIENEELNATVELMNKKIQTEKREISTLQDNLQECMDHKDDDLDSSSASSFSSSNSISSDEEDNEKGCSTASDEDDLIQLEIILSELEKDNAKLERDGYDLLGKINEERLSCSKLRADIRICEARLSIR